MLRELGVPPFVTTYQAGKLLILRPAGDLVNPLCRDFESPMGPRARRAILAHTSF